MHTKWITYGKHEIHSEAFRSPPNHEPLQDSKISLPEMVVVLLIDL